ncbi:MAG: chaperone NapD [Nitrospira sp.]|nr:chaperone NapD [bacterium]MBL7048954.1 chaperone NapD [Nitrospira sp.]
MTVSSIVVRTAPANTSSVISRIIKTDLCEVHFKDEEGRIVVTLEGENIDAMMQSVKEIQNMPDVLNVSVMYSYCGEEVGEAMEHIETRGDRIN